LPDQNKGRRKKGKKHDNDDTMSCLKALTDAASKLVEMSVTPGDAANTGDDNEDVLFGKYFTFILNHDSRHIKTRKIL
jgi:hypothetical protein